ncbi:helix-turn-helix domain-containing protein [Methylovulum psychrotolerans]|uniref:Resolvase HTH domain-containing protein n=1 Tax=Methylovulum psychrotolerans TaxID=1704499 RepID=A0A2S5CFR7_9GAMM|nr:helix-turn-helix domain-containing protein [Methylovulum psychrotolerans]POZ49640.1 hypothetical protein AADEFJLK_04587 [Methylovulum psychrotolerans]
MSKPLLSPQQWHELAERLLAGETRQALAEEYGVARKTISNRLGNYARRMQAVTEQVQAVQQEQMQTAAPADLASIAAHLAGAAQHSAMTAHRLAVIAHGQLAKLDEANPLDSSEALQAIAALTKVAHAAGQIGLSLLKANQVATQAQGDGVLPALPDDPQEAARVYQAFMGKD